MHFHRVYVYILFLWIAVLINSSDLTQSNLVKFQFQNSTLVGKLRSNLTQRKFSIRAKWNDSKSSCNNLTQNNSGTTCALKEIMIGRCYEYQYVRRGLYLSNDSHIKNCTKLYRIFESAVRYKPYCNMNLSTYSHYFDVSLQGVHVINRAMFWSGTYTATHAYSSNGANFITLEDTLAVAMVNGLVWCGKENDSEGFDFISCSNNCKDNKWADFAFWGLASQRFAELASGEVYVVLNGSQKNGRPAFRNNSYFAEFELPNLRRSGTYRVTKVNVLVLHTPDHAVMEKCGENSLRVLEERIRSHGFEYECNDDPDELILIMCGEKWDARECFIARQVLRQAWDKKLFGKSNAHHLLPSFIVFIYLFLAKMTI